jgi:hypothetical protein
MQSFTKIVVALAATAGSLVSAAPTGTALQNRDMSGDLTYYAPGLGACGVYNSEDDSIVALSWQLFVRTHPSELTASLS